MEYPLITFSGSYAQRGTLTYVNKIQCFASIPAELQQPDGLPEQAGFR